MAFDVTPRCVHVSVATSEIIRWISFINGSRSARHMTTPSTSERLMSPVDCVRCFLSLSLSLHALFLFLPFPTFYAWNEKPGRCRHIFAYKTAINDNGNCFLGKAITHNRYKPGLISPFAVSTKNVQNLGVRDCAFPVPPQIRQRQHGGGKKEKKGRIKRLLKGTYETRISPRYFLIVFAEQRRFKPLLTAVLKNRRRC